MAEKLIIFFDRTIFSDSRSSYRFDNLKNIVLSLYSLRGLRKDIFITALENRILDRFYRHHFIMIVCRLNDQGLKVKFPSRIIHLQQNDRGNWKFKYFILEQIVQLHSKIVFSQCNDRIESKSNDYLLQIVYLDR